MSTPISVRSTADAARLVLHIAGSVDLGIPRPVPLEQPTFSHLGVICVPCFEPIPLFGIGLCRHQEVVIFVMRDVDVPLDDVLWLVIELVNRTRWSS